jgi:hypothetical protein
LTHAHPFNLFSFTTFEISLDHPSPPTGWTFPTSDATGNLTIGVSARNSGSRTGDTVIQAYIHPVSVTALAQHPIKQLVDFVRLDDVAVGGSSTATFTLNRDDFLLVNEAGDRVCAPGAYKLSFEDGSGGTVQGDLTITGDVVVVDPFPKVSQ